MSASSMANTSAEPRHSSSDIISGGGFPSATQARAASVPRRSAAGESSRSSTSRFRSDTPAVYSPRAAEPYSTTDTRSAS